MNFISIFFPIFVFCAVFGYWLLGQKARIPFLLIVSYGFYCLNSRKYAILLFLMICLTYCFGRLLEDRGSKRLLITFIALSLAPLVFFKIVLFPGMEIFTNSLVLPMGITYYSFKSVGYLIDVAKGKISAERNFCKYALFVSFFSEILIGPIDRGDNLLKQLSKKLPFDFEAIKRGVLLLSWGYFQKMVIADRISVYVNSVYDDVNVYAGAPVLVAVLLYSMQIYTDFAGCTNIARGVGYMLGFEIPHNFKQPYLAGNIAQFWGSWHMSLTNWFRDYVYIPLGGNRKGKVRKQINTMIVFFLSGIWHGNGLQFVLWGVLNGFLQIIGDYKKRVEQKLQIKSTKILNIIGTYLLISFTWIFFRAPSIREGVRVIQAMFVNWSVKDLFSASIYDFALSSKNWYLLIVLLLLVLLIDCLQKRNIDIIKWILDHGFILQLVVAYSLIFGTVIFGMYGTDYQVSDFIYTNF